MCSGKINFEFDRIKIKLVDYQKNGQKDSSIFEVTINTNSTFSLSIVYPTIGRPEFLIRSIKALLRSKEKPNEIVVIDQSQGDATAEALATLKSELVKHVRSNEKGLSRARNLGVNNATGNYIGFLDDDCVPALNWVEAVMMAIEQFPETALWTGALTEDENEINDLDKLNAIQLETRSLRGKGDPYSIGPMGGNSVFRSEIFKEVGLFDPELGQGSDFPGAEDADMVYRVLRSGRTATSCNSIRCWHVDWRSEQANINNHYNYGVGIGAMLAKYNQEGDSYPFRVMFRKNFLVKFPAVPIFLILMKVRKFQSCYSWCQGMIDGYKGWKRKHGGAA